jgi:selenocysteine lyase/cysteine desulfurase
VAATGLVTRPGDNVVLVEHEFPANLRPWMPLRGRGVELRFVPQREFRVPLDDLARAIDSRTVAVALSHVQFLGGFRSDLAAVGELCRRADALFVVDAIQALGVFAPEVEANGIDLLSADAHKWLLGPPGIGLGHASARALERLRPPLEGWLAVERPLDFFDLEQPLAADARRYEEGAHNLPGLFGLRATLRLLLECGDLSARVLDLGEHLVQGLLRLGWTVLSPRARPSECSGIVLTTREGLDADGARGRLGSRGFVLSSRGGALRISPHAYTTFDELDALLDALGDEASRCHAR